MTLFLQSKLLDCGDCLHLQSFGLLKYLSKYVSRDVLDQTYKLYVRPHLDYGGIMYHKYDPDVQLNFKQLLEQTQYKAALAVSRAWMGTSRQKLLEELGWETLYNRKWCRRLCHFFSLITSKSPDYLFNEIPEQRLFEYNLRNTRCYEQNVGRTMRFSSSYFHDTIWEWNLLDKSVQDYPSLAAFRSKLLRIIRPAENPVYNVHFILGFKLLTRLRVSFCPLIEHRFRHNFDCLNLICICGTGKEEYLLHCPQFTTQRQDLLGQVPYVGYDVASMNSKDLCILLLYRNPNESTFANRIILQATITFIKRSGRFN